MMDDIWKELDDLDFSLPEKGIGPSIMDMNQPEPDDEAKGMLWEMTTKIYLWSDLENHKYQLTSTQTLVPLGDAMTLEEAKKRMQQKGRRKGTS